MSPLNLPHNPHYLEGGQSKAYKGAIRKGSRFWRSNVHGVALVTCLDRIRNSRRAFGCAQGAVFFRKTARECINLPYTNS